MKYSFIPGSRNGGPPRTAKSDVLTGATFQKPLLINISLKGLALGEGRRALIGLKKI